MRTRGAAALLLGLLAATALAAPTTERLYRGLCASCHGKDGKGQTEMGLQLRLRDLTDPSVQEQLAGDAAERQILDGSSDGRMPPFADKLTAEQAKALVQYLRALERK